MIGIVCALKCEAESLIRYFSLKPYPQKTAFPVYCDQNMFLIVSGIGKTQAAAATAYLHVLCDCRGWLNVGVGGHRDRAIGEGFFAHQVHDLESGRAYYPTFGWKLREKTTSVVTVDRVENRFEHEGIYDMEAAGFCCAAFRFSNAELIHSFKVISDNRKSAPTRDHHLIRTLIHSHIDSIESAIQKLVVLVNDLSDYSEGFATFLGKWHFTTTQQHQLKRLLQRWEACYPNKNVWDSSLQQCRNGKEVIQYLDRCFS